MDDSIPSGEDRQREKCFINVPVTCKSLRNFFVPEMRYFGLFRKGKKR